MIWMQNQVEVFKTDVPDPQQAARLIAILRGRVLARRINFDLEDCDRILRVEGEGLRSEAIIRIVEENGFVCQLLE
jgi:hypothetical protein